MFLIRPMWIWYTDSFAFDSLVMFFFMDILSYLPLPILCRCLDLFLVLLYLNINFHFYVFNHYYTAYYFSCIQCLGIDGGKKSK